MARTQTLVQLDEALLSVLDERAAQLGVSRSQLIREAISSHLSSDLAHDISTRIIEGYERIPQGTPDEWGDSDEFAAAASRETFRRLDAEERAAGHEPW